MVKKGSQTIVFLLALATWLLLTWKLELWSMVVGISISLIVSLFFGEMLTVMPGRALNPVRYLWFLLYVPLFLWEMLKANIEVAYRVLHPKLPINPGIVKIKTNLKSETAKTFLANSITLTPGTMTVDLKDDEFYIHWIWVAEKEVERATRAISEKFEKIIARIFE